ncbi:hypothetical protein GVAV_003171 [Gurleya vavrai]
MSIYHLNLSLASLPQKQSANSDYTVILPHVDESNNFNFTNLKKKENLNHHNFSNEFLSTLKNKYFKRKKRNSNYSSDTYRAEYFENILIENEAFFIRARNLETFKMNDVKYRQELYELINYLYPNITNLTSQQLKNPNNAELVEIDCLIRIIKLRSEIAVLLRIKLETDQKIVSVEEFLKLNEANSEFSFNYLKEDLQKNILKNTECLREINLKIPDLESLLKMQQMIKNNRSQ